jgi:fatty-acyl-CoA synthase
MAAYKVPASFEFVEVLPKSATGKILWRVLQEQQDERERAAT